MRVPSVFRWHVHVGRGRLFVRSGYAKRIPSHPEGDLPEIIRADIPRIAPDDGGGWFAIMGSRGWLYPTRHEAVRAARELGRDH